MSNKFLKFINLYNEKTPVFSRKIEAGKYECYSIERGFFEEDSKFIRELKTRYDTGMINAECLRCSRHGKVHSNLEECCKSFYEDANRLKQAFPRGEFNPLVSGTYRAMIIKEFFANVEKKRKGFHAEIEEPADDELEAIEGAKLGGVSFSKSGKHEGTLHQYDYNSFYPSLMRFDSFNVPYKRGIPHTIEKCSFHSPKFGLYYVEVVSVSPILEPFMRFENRVGWMTHTLVKFLHCNGYRFKMAMREDKPNFYEYPLKTHVISGDKLFKDYVDKLYALKINPEFADINPIVKNLLNRLWGILCAGYKKIEVPVDKVSSELLDSGKDLQQIIDENTGDLIALSYKALNGNMILHYIKPFLLSKGRITLGEHIAKYHESLIYCATDSLISTKPLDVNVSNLMYHFTHKTYNTIEIKNFTTISRS